VRRRPMILLFGIGCTPLLVTRALPPANTDDNRVTEHSSAAQGASAAGADGDSSAREERLEPRERTARPDAGTLNGSAYSRLKPCPDTFVSHHLIRAPGVRKVAMAVKGRRAPEGVERAVRQNFGRYRMCYEQGLARDPDLAGEVTLRFVIDGQGRVLRAASYGRALPDEDVVSCVASAFYSLPFGPQGATMTSVSYTLAFTPSCIVTRRPQDGLLEG